MKSISIQCCIRACICVNILSLVPVDAMINVTDGYLAHSPSQSVGVNSLMVSANALRVQNSGRPSRWFPGAAQAGRTIVSFWYLILTSREKAILGKYREWKCIVRTIRLGDLRAYERGSELVQERVALRG